MNTCHYCKETDKHVWPAGCNKYPMHIDREYCFSVVQEQNKKLRDALKEIAFMGTDCPVGMDKESMYGAQLRKCIGIAAHARALKENE